MDSKIRAFFNFDIFLLSDYIKWWFVLGLFPTASFANRLFNQGPDGSMVDTFFAFLAMALIWRFLCEYLIVLFKIHESIYALNGANKGRGTVENGEDEVDPTLLDSQDKWAKMADEAEE